MFSIPTAPAKQSVGETITVLSGRLSSATLLEDRRAAILGLRSFAKDFPASVASGALRSLIGSLSRDAEDVDTVKVVLETLLMLFSPNEKSPEASEDIALWLADEFTMRQENITLLLNLLESGDFYSRLYSLQLLAAILSSRTERTEECVFTAPLGISRLVAVLDDTREAVRNEAIALLTYLTPSSTDIQKLVAFENAFDRLFNVIGSEGHLLEGDRVVEDCLILLANLLRRNPSNQSLFRESGGTRRLAILLEGAEQAQREEAEIASWAQLQQNRNIYALLAVHGLLYHALQLAFSRVARIPIKAEALVTCSDIIRGNSTLQERFAQLQVLSPLDHRSVVESGQANDLHRVYVIDGLLDLTLSAQEPEAFDLRLAACECLKAYLDNHADIRLHFLKRAIEGYKTGADETANVLTVLLRPPADAASSNPYRYWFAATIMFHLVFDNPEAKSLAMAVTEGDADSGEEVVTSIQTVAAHLISGLNREEDSRVIVGYLMLLLGWLFEDLDAVNDFLDEGPLRYAARRALRILDQRLAYPTVQASFYSGLEISVVTNGIQKGVSRELVDSLRSQLHEREQALQRASSSLETVGRQIGQEQADHRRTRETSALELARLNQVNDGLREQYDLEIRALQSRIASMQQEHQLQMEEARRKFDSEVLSLEEVHRKQIEDLRGAADTRVAKLEQVHEEEKQQLQQAARAQSIAQQDEHLKQLVLARKAAESDADRTRHRAEADIADLKATISRLEVDLMRAKKIKMQEIQDIQEEAEKKIETQKRVSSKAETRVKQLELELLGMQQKSAQTDMTLKKAEEDQKATQNELDDLLMVFGDLEEKVAKYKAQLKKLGETVSDGEDEYDDDEDEYNASEEDDSGSDNAVGEAAIDRDK
ncbi:Intracellular protein transport protein USO1 [Colletotrichum orbiculare MAFF 240422]|uniref:Intracellular protein transport protein USO1 n=1 Tax=Colletotrichum orbiculare (strain 104-T / ATCC 96160 / CBS 514.97 / LARS 414 / MAFF 240422) TaxID=1213857 RepID=A0A484FZ81_COLOR|nr:Intracellular protein transport protein USO1 [Colletotrichum orbiculare MAFF 240422]